MHLSNSRVGERPKRLRNPANWIPTPLRDSCFAQYRLTADVMEEDYTTRLPSEILSAILDELEQPAVLAGARVCHRWRHIAKRH